MENLDVLKNNVSVMSTEEMQNINGGGWVYKIVQKTVKIIRDGVVYDAIVEVAEWVYENGGAEPTVQDKQRIDSGLTHIGGRQPWL